MRIKKSVMLVSTFLFVLWILASCVPLVPSVPESWTVEYNAMITTGDTATELFDEYIQTYSEEQAPQMVVNWLEAQSGIQSAGISDDGVSIWFEYENDFRGVLLTYDVGEETSTEGTSRSAASKLSTAEHVRLLPSNKKALLLDPFPTIFLGWAGHVKNKLTSAGYNCEAFEGGQVSIEHMRSLSLYGVVAINTHGGLLKDQVVICTGLKESKEYSKQCEEELKRGDIVIAWIRYLGLFWKVPYYAITPSFIELSASGLYPKSLIYMGGCNTLRNTTLAEAFINKGAHTYCGWNIKVRRISLYNDTKKLFTNLIDQKKDVPEAIVAVGNPSLNFYSPTPGDLTLLPRVLFCDTHNPINGYASISSHFAPLISYLEDAKYIVDIVDMSNLEDYDILVLADPHLSFNTSEITSIQTFLQRGGKLVMLGEHGEFSDNSALNALSISLGIGITINQDIVYDDADNYQDINHWPLISDFVSHAVTTDVSTVFIGCGSSLNVTSPATVVAWSDQDSYNEQVAEATKHSPLSKPMVLRGSKSRGPFIMIAVSEVNDGKVFVVGDTNLWSYDKNIDSFSLYDNEKLAENVFSW